MPGSTPGGLNWGWVRGGAGWDEPLETRGLLAAETPSTAPGAAAVGRGAGAACPPLRVLQSFAAVG